MWDARSGANRRCMAPAATNARPASLDHGDPAQQGGCVRQQWWKSISCTTRKKRWRLRLDKGGKNETYGIYGRAAYCAERVRGKRRSCAGKFACKIQIWLLAPLRETLAVDVFGFVLAPSFLRANYSIPLIGNREIRPERLPPRYQQKYQQNDRLRGALSRISTYVFKCAAQILLKNKESNQRFKLLLLLMFYTWCPWPIIA